MKKLLSVIFLLIASHYLMGQNIEWANKVLEFSSQFGVRQYSANQVLGRPNVLPSLGASPNAWSPKRNGRMESIKVGFARPMEIQQIAIAETSNPGGIKQIFVYDTQGQEHLLYTFEPHYLPIEGRLFRLFFDKTPYDVSAVKVAIDGSVLHGHFGIDAIAISDSRDPITVEINVTDKINNAYVPVPLGPTVNTPYRELRPLITPNAKTLYFSRRNYPGNIGGVKDDEDIWYADRDSINEDWQEAKNIGRPLNNKGPNFISSISSDGQNMLLLLGNAYYSKNRMTQGVSMSKKNPDGTWSKPVNLKIANDYNISDKANYFLANDKNVLLMAVQRRDTHGDRDLYVSFKKDDGSWSEPKNMGGVVNSAAEEGSPFLASDGKTLFFSSKGFSGFGGYDIYLSRRLDDTWTNWSEPENLGDSFNSPQDDIFFNFTENDEYAYFTRGDKDNTDIYKVKLPYYQKPVVKDSTIIVTIRGTVFNSATLKPIESSIEFDKDFVGKQIKLVAADTLGYRTTLPEKHQYEITAKSPGFYNTTDTLDLRHITESTDIVKDLYLDPIVKNEPVVLNNVYFDFDRDKIRPESFPELNKISEMLLDNPKLHMTIDGHTCSIGSEAYNQDLSQRRARSIVNYLISTGVDADRLDFHGYGELRPIASNATEAGRELNRRVEFKLTETSQN